MRPFAIGQKKSLVGVLAMVLLLAACGADSAAPPATLVYTEDSTHTATTNSSVERTESATIIAVSPDATFVKLAPFPAASFTPTVKLTPTFTSPVLSAITSTSVPTAATLNTIVTPSAQLTTSSFMVQAVINSDSAVNVREGPGRTFAPVASVKPGTIVLVIGRNGDGQWIQIRLDNGTEGWVSAILVIIQEPTASG